MVLFTCDTHPTLLLHTNAANSKGIYLKKEEIGRFSRSCYCPLWNARANLDGKIMDEYLVCCKLSHFCSFSFPMLTTKIVLVKLLLRHYVLHDAGSRVNQESDISYPVPF